jgi:hypothetical protein
MALGSGIRRYRVLGTVCVGMLISLIAFAFVASSARAETRLTTGGETRLEVNINSFLKMVNDGIQVTPIAPARLEFGARPAAVFPASSGVADAVLKTAAVPHQGGLRLTKPSINFSLDATNVTLSCVNAGTITVAGCRLLNTANNLLPNELAEVQEFTITDANDGKVEVTGFARINGVTALVLNTLFQTNIFAAGDELGTVRSSFTYKLPWPGL